MYSPSNEWLSHSTEYWSRYHCIHFVLTLIKRKFGPENHCIKFVLKLLGKEYTCHVKIVKELKERSDIIYRTVMVSVIQNPQSAIHTAHTLTFSAVVF